MITSRSEEDQDQDQNQDMHEAPISLEMTTMIFAYSFLLCSSKHDLLMIQLPSNKILWV